MEPALSSPSPVSPLVDLLPLSLGHEEVSGSTTLDNAETATYSHTLTVTGRLGGLYRFSVQQQTIISCSRTQCGRYCICIMKCNVLFMQMPILPPAPSPPSGLSVSQNGLDSALVSWTVPSGGAAVTGYIIYYQQEEGGQRLSESAEAAAITASITGLITGATYITIYGSHFQHSAQHRLSL